MAEETAKALDAFERYWAMGPTRSLRKLAEHDVQQGYYEGKTDSCFQLLAEWSSKYDWQDRIRQRVIEEADLAREQYRERADKHRQRLLAAIETDSARYVERLKQNDGELMADDAFKLEKLTKLYYQLAEQPLADRHEVTGKDGGPVEVAWWADVEQAQADDNGDSDDEANTV